MLSLRVTMIVVMQFTKRNRVERMMVPSILPPPNNIYPVSPSFVATTILLFYYLMIVIGVPSKVLVGDTSYAPYYTKNNSPADVFGALNFMMSASLEHHSVADDNSSLVDTLLVKIKQSSFPKDHRTPECIHANCFGKPNKLFCRFVIEYIAMSLFFDYWGEHSAASAPAPFNEVSMYSILLLIKLIVSNLNTLNFKCYTVFLGEEY